MQHGKLKFVSHWIRVHRHFATRQIEVCKSLDLGPLTFCMWHVKRTRVTLKEHGVQSKADRSAQPDRKRWVRCYIDNAFPAYCLPHWTREERRVTCAQHVSVLIDRCVRQSWNKMSSFPAIRPQSPLGNGSKRFESFATWQVEVCKWLDLGPLTFCMWHVKRTRVTLKEHGVQSKADRSAQPDRKNESVATLTLPFLHIVCLIEQGKRDYWILLGHIGAVVGAVVAVSAQVLSKKPQPVPGNLDILVAGFSCKDSWRSRAQRCMAIISNPLRSHFGCDMRSIA